MVSTLVGHLFDSKHIFRVLDGQVDVATSSQKPATLQVAQKIVNPISPGSAHDSGEWFTRWKSVTHIQ